MRRGRRPASIELQQPRDQHRPGNAQPRRNLTPRTRLPHRTPLRRGHHPAVAPHARLSPNWQSRSRKRTITVSRDSHSGAGTTSVGAAGKTLGQRALTQHQGAAAIEDDDGATIGSDRQSDHDRSFGEARLTWGAAMATLAPEVSAQLITALRHGRGLGDAARELRLDLAALWATARTDTRLTAEARTPRRRRQGQRGRITCDSWPSDCRRPCRTHPRQPPRGHLAHRSRVREGLRRGRRGGGPLRGQPLGPAHPRHRGPVSRRPAHAPHTSAKAAAAAAGVTTQAIYQRRRRDRRVRLSHG